MKIALVLVLLFFSLTSDTKSQDFNSSLDCISVNDVTDFNWAINKRIVTEIDISSQDILALSNASGISFYEVSDFSLIDRISIAIGETFNIEWSNNDKYLAISYWTAPETVLESGNHIVQIYDANTLELIASYNDFKYVDWSSDDSQLVTSNLSTELFVFAFGNSELSLLTNQIENLPIGLDWSPTSNHILISDGVGNHFIWDINANQVDQVASDASTNQFLTAWSLDGDSYLIAGELTALLSVFNFKSHQEITSTTLHNWIHDVNWAVEDRFALGTNQGIQIASLEDSRLTLSKYEDEDIPEAARLRWSSDAKYIVYVDFVGNLYKWDVDNKCIVDTISFYPKEKTNDTE